MIKKRDFEELEVMVLLRNGIYHVFTHKRIETHGYSSTDHLKRCADKQHALNYARGLAESLELLISVVGVEMDDKDLQIIGDYLIPYYTTRFIRVPWVYIKVDQSIDGPSGYSSYDRVKPRPGYKLHPGHNLKDDVVIPITEDYKP